MNENRSLELLKLAMEEKRKDLHIAIEKFGRDSEQASIAGADFDKVFVEYLTLSKEQ